MKRTFIFLAALVLLAGCGKDNDKDLVAQYFFDDDNSINMEEYALSRGLVAYYAFEGTTADSSANRLHAEVSGNIIAYAGHREGTSSAYFDGNKDNYVYVNANDKLKLDVWTINLWFKCTDINYRDGSLIQMGSQNRSGAFDITPRILYITISNYGEWQWGSINPSDTSWYPTINNWHMITTQVSGCTVSQYLDGKHMWTDNLKADYINRTNSKLYIGISTWEYSFKYPFKGCIDDVRIYNRILSESEIKYLYKK